MRTHFQLEALEKLLPTGFKKQREFFFLIREPNIMVLFRKFAPNGQETYFLAFTHTFFSQVVNQSGKYLIPPLLEQYPVSIATDQLRIQYEKHSSVRAFDCQLHHLQRTLQPEGNSVSQQPASLLSYLKKLFAKKEHAPTYNPVDITLLEGIRLFNEFSPELSCQVLSANNLPYSHMIADQLAECRKFIGS